MYRYYDETDREFEMMQQINGPQRGRRSQHHSRNNRPAGGINRPGRGNNAETEMGGGTDYPPSSPSSPNPNKNVAGNDAHTMESGFFNNKYAVNDDQVDVRNNKTDPSLDQNKAVIILFYFIQKFLSNRSILIEFIQMKIRVSIETEVEATSDRIAWNWNQIWTALKSKR